MREYLFRGKRVDGYGWIYGGLIYDEAEHNTPRIVIGREYSTGTFFNAQAPRVMYDTVGEFTGLYDKNNNKIFEGDIVNWYGEILVVKFGEHNVVEQSYEIGNHFRTVDKFGWFGERQNCFISKGIDLILLKAGEVIGNIYDNPELLEEK